ncbi:hypothetical protein DVK00_18485 [Haloarcula sp. Atlit-47R]|uniref:hypothetical protein n=1 Tax=Haloarcula sp. Atlit-47R TaxID=2282132 RepID=UPI000EF1A143|nr:hypothetical protein [Haloarcula sp. Atlit-47R]RLM42040.1 hypothetical protein DVK00_18485 [Haloarcula sp. Atlit-47R]
MPEVQIDWHSAEEYERIRDLRERHGLLWRGVLLAGAKDAASTDLVQAILRAHTNPSSSTSPVSTLDRTAKCSSSGQGFSANDVADVDKKGGPHDTTRSSSDVSSVDEDRDAGPRSFQSHESLSNSGEEPSNESRDGEDEAFESLETHSQAFEDEPISEPWVEGEETHDGQFDSVDPYYGYDEYHLEFDEGQF